MLVVSACASSPPGTDRPTAVIDVGDSRLSVWVASDSSERRQGLRGVEELPAGIDGMLFSYSSPVSAVFTMEDTPMPLDIWWFDADGRLLGTTAMTPCLVEPCVRYGSPGPIRWALETPQGTHRFLRGDLLSNVENG